MRLRPHLFPGHVLSKGRPEPMLPSVRHSQLIPGGEDPSTRTPWSSYMLALVGFALFVFGAWLPQPYSILTMIAAVFVMARPTSTYL